MLEVKESTVENQVCKNSLEIIGDFSHDIGIVVGERIYCRRSNSKCKVEMGNIDAHKCGHAHMDKYLSVESTGIFFLQEEGHYHAYILR